MISITELRKRYAEYITSLRANGVTVLKFTVPCCGATEEGRAGPTEGQWDSLASCSHCGTLYLKISTAEKITAHDLAEATR